MKLEDLTVGSKIVFGSYTPRDNQEPKELEWTKVTDDGHCVLVPGQLSSGVFDHREPRATNRDRRAHGYNYFPFSNIFQFINSPDASWFRPLHDTDEWNQYRTLPYGFLFSFSPEEISQLRPQSIKVAVPEGSRKQHGTVAHLNCLVTLPSLSQCQEHVAEDLKREGEYIPLLHEGSVFAGWTRTGAGGCYKAYILKRYGGWTDLIHCDESANISPMILLNQQIETLDHPDGNGRYYLNIVSESMNNIMSDDFLKMIFQ